MTLYSLLNLKEEAPEEMIPISQEVSQKIANLSFILSCLVVSLHIPEVSTDEPVIWVQRLFRVGLARIAVPYFFGISGFLIAGKINPENYKNEIFKRIRSLMIPFWFWGFLFVCLRYVLFFVYERKEGNTLPSELYPSWELLVTWMGVKPSDTLSILWFLRTLFFFVCFSPVIIHAIKIFQYKLIVILWILFVCWKMIGGFIFPGINSFFEYGLSLSGICAFSLGLCIRMYGFHLPHVIKYICISLACVLWSITWIVVEYFGLNVRGGIFCHFSSLVVHMPFGAWYHAVQSPKF